MRTGLIGFGSIAENGHLPALLSFPETEIVAVADVSADRLSRVHDALPNARLFESGLDLLRDDQLDLAVICTPPATHAALIVAGCETGVRKIVSEKPLVLSEAEYDCISGAAATSNSQIVSVNNWMQSDLHRHVMSALTSGAIGEVQSIELVTERLDAASGQTGWLPAWRIRPEHAGGGIILDHGWHQMYLVLAWVRQPLKSVSAFTRTADPRHYPVEDEAWVELDFGDATGRIELSWTGAERRNSGSIVGSKGRIEILDDRIVVDGPMRQELPFSGRLTQSSYHPDWFEVMYRRTVFTPDPAEPARNFKEAGVLVKAISAAYRSAQGGSRPIPVGDDKAV